MHNPAIAKDIFTRMHANQRQRMVIFKAVVMVIETVRLIVGLKEQDLRIKGVQRRRISQQFIERLYGFAVELLKAKLAVQ